MNRILLIFLLVIAAKVSRAQDYLGRSEEKIKKEYIKMAERNDSFKVVFKDSIIDTDSFYLGQRIIHDTIADLNVFIEGFERADAKYFFAGSDDYCDSAVVKFYCSICAEKHLKEIISDYKRYWRSIDSSNYYSIYRLPFEESFGSKHLFAYPRLRIIRTPQEPVCVTVIYSIVWLDKEEIKQLTLKK